MLTTLLTELMRYPLVAMTLVIIAGILQALAWFRILKKTELPPVYVIVGTLCSLESISMAPLFVVPLAIAALVPWPVSEPPYLRQRRSS
ncbi:MAG: hypothetical protein AAF609_24870 [Cyanobacteria bacterium P01_C01_bin.120]